MPDRARNVRIRGDSASLRRAARRTLRKLRCHRLSIDVFIVDERRAAVLNRRYRGKRKPAEVLAFPLPQVEPGGNIGQICVCPSVAARRAASIGRSRSGWLEELAVHGALHVLGFGHRDPAAAREMFSLQRSLTRCR